MKKLQGEFRHFLSCPRDMRVLILANMAYAFVQPVINNFVSTYLMRESGNVALVVAYQMTLFSCIPLMFFVTALMLRSVPIKWLYASSMPLIAVAMAVLTSRDKVTPTEVAFVGIVMGTAIGIHWANRGFLAFSATTNANRNYYYAVENAVLTLAGVLMPLAAGGLIAATVHDHWLGGKPENAYRVLTAAVFAFTIAAAWIVLMGRFSNPPLSRFLYFWFPPLWYRFQAMAVLKGMVQPFLVTGPAMLIMHVAREDESALGVALAAGGLIAAATLYAIGRRSSARHRVLILGAGVLMFAAATSINAVMFNRLGVWLFMLFMLVGSPLLELGYFTIEMHVIDTLAAREQRNPFAYILNHEFSLFAGRILGCGLFIAVAKYGSANDALRYALGGVGLLHLLTIPVARIVCRECE